jgi:hypothetical protein
VISAALAVAAAAQNAACSFRWKGSEGAKGRYHTRRPHTGIIRRVGELLIVNALPARILTAGIAYSTPAPATVPGRPSLHVGVRLFAAACAAGATCAAARSRAHRPVLRIEGFQKLSDIIQ